MSTIFFYSAAQAHVEHRTDAPVIAVKGFKRGFYPIYTRARAADLNSAPADVLESALAASMFGWHTPAAQVARAYVEQREREETQHGNV